MSDCAVWSDDDGWPTRSWYFGFVNGGGATWSDDGGGPRRSWVLSFVNGGGATGSFVADGALADGEVESRWSIDEIKVLPSGDRAVAKRLLLATGRLHDVVANEIE